MGSGNWLKRSASRNGGVGPHLTWHFDSAVIGRVAPRIRWSIHQT